MRVHKVSLIKPAGLLVKFVRYAPTAAIAKEWAQSAATQFECSKKAFSIEQMNIASDKAGMNDFINKLCKEADVVASHREAQMMNPKD
jgi:hypothetical protein